MSSSDRRKSRLILALDVTGPERSRLKRAVSIMQEVGDYVAAVKVNFHLILPFGLQGLTDVIDVCVDKDIPLIADLKLNDIESTNIDVANSLISHHFDAVIANPFAGWEEGLGKLARLSVEDKLGLILLVFMSHRGSTEGYSLLLKDGRPVYSLFVERAKLWRADGVVVSSKKTETIRDVKKQLGPDILIFSPGIGAQGGDVKACLGAGTDFIIVGRSIVEANRPHEAAIYFRDISFQRGQV